MLSDATEGVADRWKREGRAALATARSMVGGGAWKPVSADWTEESKDLSEHRPRPLEAIDEVMVLSATLERVAVFWKREGSVVDLGNLVDACGGMRVEVVDVTGQVWAVATTRQHLCQLAAAGMSMNSPC